MIRHNKEALYVAKLLNKILDFSEKCQRRVWSGLARGDVLRLE